MIKQNYQLQVRLSKREKKILELLTAYEALNTRQIIDYLYPDEHVRTHSSTYNSIIRTLTKMRKKDLITRVIAETMWKKL